MSTSADTVAPGLASPMNNTFGALLIGTFISLMLYGLTMPQTYGYFRTYGKDNRFLKSMVIVLFCIDMFYSILCMHICYHFLVMNFLSPEGLLDGVWSVQLLTSTTAAIVFITQGFYARRIYLLRSRHIVILVPAVLFLLCAVGFAIAATIETFKQIVFTKWTPFTWLASAGLAFTLPTDILLTGTLITYLRRSRTGIRQTDSMLNVLIVYTINTGLLTSTMCLLCLIFAFLQPENLIYIGSVAKLGLGQTSYEFGTFGMISGERHASRHLPSPIMFAPPHTSVLSSSHADVINIRSKQSTISRTGATGRTGPTAEELSREEVS